MSNPRIPFAFSTERPKLSPLDGRRIIAHLVVNVEHWRFDQPMPRTLLTPPHGQGSVPDVPNFAWAEYGLRCGLTRMIDAVRSRGLRCAASLNASVIDSHPRAAEAMLEAGWEFIGHGLHQRALTQAGEVAPHEVIASALSKIHTFTGAKPNGWLSPGLRETLETPDLLAAAGLDYVLDWCLDDLPNWMQVASGTLLSVPYSLELNDSVVYAVEKHSGTELLNRVERSLAVLATEAEHGDRSAVLAIGLHPHLMGVPHRFQEFTAILDLLAAHPQVVVVSAGDIHRWYAAQVPALADTPRPPSKVHP